LKVGRPKGTIKVPGRLKIKNPNGIKIDADSAQYNKNTRKGYNISADGMKLLLPENVVPKILKFGKPKGSKNKT